jgi:hypothetical protein
MTDPTILSHAEALAEITRLRARITELEAAIAVFVGTVANPPPPDEPATITHDVPPNAPPHNE